MPLSCEMVLYINKMGQNWSGCSTAMRSSSVSNITLVYMLAFYVLVPYAECNSNLVITVLADGQTPCCKMTEEISQNIAVIWTSWRVKAPAIPLFVQHLFWRTSKKTWELLDFHEGTVDYPHKGAVTRKRSHVIASSWWGPKWLRPHGEISSQT